MASRQFKELFAIPLRNGLTKPKAVRGAGTKMVNMGELFANPRIVDVAMDRVPLNQAERSSSLLAAGDLLFARQSLVLSGAGKCSIFVGDDEDVCFESHVIRCRLNQELADPYFYYYFFSSPVGRTLIESIVEQGAGASGIRGSDLAELPVPWIDPTVQRRIAGVLSQIDDKIAVNRRINQTLEAMAQAIFKSWFVDFDPVKAKIAAKAEGRDPLRAAMRTISGKPDAELDTLPPEQFDQLAATAALFPDEMEGSELGEIPRGWTTAVLSDTAEVIMGQSPDGNTYNDSGDGMALINGPVEFDSYHPKRIKWTTQPTKTSQPGDLIVCVRGSTTGKFVKSDGIYCLGRGVCAIRAQEPSWQPFVDQTYKFSLTALLSLATGSTFPNWSGPTLKNYRILQPQPDVIVAYSLLVQSVISQISTNDLENKSLSSIRDTLLPKLLSGELPVTEFTVEAEA